MDLRELDFPRQGDGSTGENTFLVHACLRKVRRIHENLPNDYSRQLCRRESSQCPASSEAQRDPRHFQCLVKSLLNRNSVSAAASIEMVIPTLREADVFAWHAAVGRLPGQPEAQYQPAEAQPAELWKRVNASAGWYHTGSARCPPALSPVRRQSAPPARARAV